MLMLHLQKEETGEIEGIINKNLKSKHKCVLFLLTTNNTTTTTTNNTTTTNTTTTTTTTTTTNCNSVVTQWQ